MKKIFFLCLYSLLTCMAVNAQTIAKFTVEAGKTDRFNTPVFADVTGLEIGYTSALILEEDTKSGKKAIECQLERTPYGDRIWWMLTDETKAGKKRTFILSKSEPKETAPQMTTLDTGGSLIFFMGDRHVLQYNHATSYPPQGVDTVFRRSGYIHPVWSPAGMALTNIQPTDHYHHYGIWNPWTKTKFEGKEIDFWNLNRKLGTVRFENFLSVLDGDVFAEAKIILHHVVFPDTEKEKNAMREECDIRVWNTGQSAFVWDFTSTLNCATQSPITLEEYRYAGFGFRATNQWVRDNCTMLTSEGKTRKDADGSLARWAFVTGKTQEDHCGLLFLGYPANYNFPEPIRIWNENANGGRGDYFFNFVPTKNMDWNLLPGNDYRLKYRVVVYHGDMTREKAEQYWQAFAYPPKVSMKVL
jgi:hypothetical protein